MRLLLYGIGISWKPFFYSITCADQYNEIHAMTKQSVSGLWKTTGMPLMIRQSLTIYRIDFHWFRCQIMEEVREKPRMMNWCGPSNFELSFHIEIVMNPFSSLPTTVSTFSLLLLIRIQSMWRAGRFIWNQKILNFLSFTLHSSMRLNWFHLFELISSWNSICCGTLD